ncbi:MAG TPA: metallophosphoesterase family protein [Pirellulales bacterium]|nr:metallophosphoesterase family protein [Pirellulales bacterium]
MRTIAIGDTHGCSVALARLLEAISPQPSDAVVPLGDYIDRGPDSPGVLEQFIDLAARCRLTPILGNHEEMLLASMRGTESMRLWLACGGLATMKSYGSAAGFDKIPAKHIEFIENCKLLHVEDDFFFVHANYDPQTALEQQPRDVLLWQSLREFTPGPHCSGKTAVVGHTLQPDGKIRDLGHLKCIDTGCYTGGWLTAIDVESGHIWQTNQRGELRESASDDPALDASRAR